MTDERADLVGLGASRAIAYLEQASESPVFPDDEAVAALSGFTSDLPAGPADPAHVLTLLDDLGSPATVRSTNGRYFGFVTGGTEPVVAGASILAATWDQNAALPVLSPVAAHLDAIAARWVCELLGLPAEATAAFCGGASIANLTCLITARDALLARAGWNVDQRGLSGAPPIAVVTSEEIHISVVKSLRAAGIGRDAITFVPTDHCGRVEPSAVPEIGPLSLVILQAGNVNTGHSDPFTDIIPTVVEAGGWTHVDGAFGLWAAASPTHQHLVAGAELADSWATDAHKWLNTTYDAGIAICARGDDLRRSMAADAAYVETSAERAPMHLGLQMSQRARAIETWAVIAARGRSGITDLVDDNCRQAAMMAALLTAGGAEVLVPVGLNQVLVSFGDDDTTSAVIESIQADRTCWAGGTTWQGRRAMRVSVSDSTTTDHDIEVSAEAMLRCWREISQRAEAT